MSDTETAPFGSVLKWRDDDRGAELGRYMLIRHIDNLAWADSKPGVEVICLFNHPGDGWETGETAPCEAARMEVVE